MKSKKMLTKKKIAGHFRSQDRLFEEETYMLRSEREK